MTKRQWGGRPTILSWAIRNQREAMGLTQAALARKCGVERSYISAVERGGRRNLSWDTLEKIATGLETTTADLLRLAGSIQEGGATNEVLTWLDRDKATRLKKLERLPAAALDLLEHHARDWLALTAPAPEADRRRPSSDSPAPTTAHTETTPARP